MIRGVKKRKSRRNTHRWRKKKQYDRNIDKERPQSRDKHVRVMVKRTWSGKNKKPGDAVFCRKTFKHQP